MKFVPTYLYIKQHLITGKFYFGKTNRKDPVRYLGSGSHWVNHFNKHGKDHVVTLWYCLFTEQGELTKFALEFSEKMDIVKSKQWLNQIPENGLGGATIGHRVSQKAIDKLIERNKTRICTEETRQRMSLASKDKPKSRQHCANISASKLGVKRGPLTKEWKQHLSDSLKDKPKSAETIKRMKDAPKDYIQSEAWKQSHATSMAKRVGMKFITDGVQNKLVTMEEAKNAMSPWKQGMTKGSSCRRRS